MTDRPDSEGMAAELPAGLDHVRTTPTFTAESVPAGLRNDHQLAPGVWGLLAVASGTLTLVFDGTDVHRTLSAGDVAIIPPECVHHVELDELASFSIQIHRQPR